MNDQAQFVAALLDPAQPCPAQLTSWNEAQPSRRFAVYRNNLIGSLVDALADGFPVVQQLVGEAFFRAMAQVFVRQSPPRSAVMLDYGADFPAFVEGFEPAGGLPYLADVARLERLRSRAYHAADSPALDAAALAGALAEPDRLASLVFQLHASVAVLASRFAVVSLWAAHQGLLDITRVGPYGAESALVLRHGLEVEVIGLRAGDATFIQGLQVGMPLGRAAERALDEDPAFDLSVPLAQLIRTGVIGDYHYATDRHRI
ncbi:HvfC/BufC N-terminal domain-containing protein [Pseudomonas sp. SP16.1]|uniref:HvfC/BufC N-terminal domain-containing protein n=1 Tax=Pseudomonas sp. SP16.1 TaxID=3458854 RepID=UPI0040463AF5